MIFTEKSSNQAVIHDIEKKIFFYGESQSSTSKMAISQNKEHILKNKR